MNKRTEIYGTHRDHHVRTVVLYGRNGSLCFDKDLTQRIKPDEIVDLYLNNRVIVFDLEHNICGSIVYIELPESEGYAAKIMANGEAYVTDGKFELS